MAINARRYCDIYTWSHALTENAVAHGDGASSLAIVWDGLDAEFEDGAARARLWATIGHVVERLKSGYWLEFHLWRERNPGAVCDYRAHYEKAPRKSPFAAHMRAAIADHLAPYMITNTVALIVGCLPIMEIGIRRALNGQAQRAAELEAFGAELAALLPGGRVATVLEYARLIQKSYDRGPPLSVPDPWLSLAEQLIVVPPQPGKRLLEVNGRAVRVFYLHLYPDIDAAWILPHVSGAISLHISQVIMPASTERALRASERADRLMQGAMARKGRERQVAALKDMQGFRQQAADHDWRVHRNAYVVCVDLDNVPPQALTRLVEGLQGKGGRVRDDDFVQLPFFRISQPGQGYRSPIWRPDHGALIAAMAPAQVFRTGPRPCESLRLGLASQPVAFDYSHQAVAHGFTVAMTGAGKGVDKVATIAETYPFGIDWYVLEIGSTYRWVIEALGGRYTRLDPGAAAVNPLPPRAAGVAGLDPLLASGTLNILAFILTDGRTLLDFHEAAAGAAALTRLYDHASAPDPGLADLLHSLERLSDVSPEQAQAARVMAANLHSFLDTPEGRLFAERDNVQISPGISGIDLKDVDRASPKLLTFYLVFLCLRFLNLAFAGRNQARVLLDEIHRFVAHAPGVLSRLVSEIARMGRKEAAAIDIVTQGLSEIDLMEKEIVNSMPLRSLLYRNDGWEEIGARIGMPQRALDIWKRLPFPLNLPWRPAIRSVGPEYYALRLTFPKTILALADTTPEGLARKERLGAEITDPLARLARFLENTP
ncbi:hypothetical protein [Acidiferrobacter sp.]|uniref:hypothetical protein n=1 Tax=Acidiferrobacter sp. TaxID=1872107 RepID=UPI00262C6577|nr:hypothetical protein [Acidiferrobacter sp.]